MMLKEEKNLRDFLYKGATPDHPLTIGPFNWPTISRRIGAMRKALQPPLPKGWVVVVYNEHVVQVEAGDFEKCASFIRRS